MLYVWNTEVSYVSHPLILTMKLIIDHSKTINQLVEESKFDYCDSDINDTNFPIAIKNEVEECEATLVDIGKDWTKEEAETKLKELGLVSAEIRELLSFAIQYSKEQRKNPIVELESIWRDKGGNPCVARVGGNSDYRTADLDHVASKWHRHYRVLALSKVTRTRGSSLLETVDTRPLEPWKFCPHCGKGLR